jgi:orotate phosphoribosyltransferase-like protein
MSSGGDRRFRVLAQHAYRLKRQGLTSRQIAAQLGIKPDKVKHYILSGERQLADAEATPKVPA